MLASGAPLLSMYASSSKADRAPIAPAALTPEEPGYFSGVLPGAGPGTRYRLRLDDDETPMADPVSRLQPEGIRDPSKVVDPPAFAGRLMSGRRLPAGTGCRTA